MIINKYSLIISGLNINKKDIKFKVKYVVREFFN